MKSLEEIAGACFVAAVAIVGLIGCKETVTYIDDVRPVAFDEIKPATPEELIELKFQAVNQQIKQLETRLADLERKCCCNQDKPKESTPPFEREQKRNLTPRERVKCIVYSQPSCGPCQRLKAAIKEKLTGKLGWKAGETDDNDIIYRDSEQQDVYPTIEFRVDDSPKLRVKGVMPVEDLSRKLLEFIQAVDEV